MWSPESSPAQPSMPRSRQTERTAQESAERAAIEVLLLEHSEKINEGNNGIILSFRPDELSASAKNLLRKQGILEAEGETERVAKLLKIGAPGKLHKEYTLGKLAWNTIDQHRKTSPQPLASIPQPRFYDEIEITPFLQSLFLDRHGIHAPAGGHLEIMAMDRVPGTDLDTLMLRAFLKKNINSPLRHTNDLTTFSHGDMEQIAAQSLGYRLPFDAPRRSWESADWATYARFRDQMEASLSQDGFAIDAHHLRALEQTVHILHDEAQIIWGDGNLRNIMFEGSEDDPQQPWVIDFGGSDLASDVTHPELAKKQAIAVLQKIQQLFRRHTPVARPRSYSPEERATFTKPSRASEHLALQLRDIFSANGIQPYHRLLPAIGRIDAAEYLAPALFRLAEHDDSVRQRIILSVQHWLQDPSQKTHVNNARLQNALRRLLTVLQ